MSRTRVGAWDNFHDQNSHITRLGYADGMSKKPLEREHLNSSLDILYDANLTVAQIDALSEAIYYTYQLGRKVGDGDL